MRFSDWKKEVLQKVLGYSKSFKSMEQTGRMLKDKNSKMTNYSEIPEFCTSKNRPAILTKFLDKMQQCQH